MLNQINIRNFAIIDALELEFRPGMTVLTGETGAGKSILVDALGLVLGDRADSDVVRHGETRAEISAEFTIDTLPAVRAWLQQNDLDEENDCTLRRVVSAEGRSKCYINGRPASLQLIKTLGEMLVDIHGQHQHQSLLKSDIQRQLLDDYGAHQPLAEQTRSLQQRWKTSLDKLEQLRQSGRDRDARLDLLRYHVQELTALALGPGELQALEEEQRRLAHGGSLLEQCVAALNTLYDDDEVNAQDLINHSLADLQQLRDIDPRLSNICNLINEASIQIQEAGSELRHYVEQLELDPARLERVDQRLGAIHDLARKHHVDPEALPALQQSFSDELHRIENADMVLDQLQEELKQLLIQYQASATKLSQARHKSAKKLSAAVTEIIRQLGMPAGEFKITLQPREEQTPHRHGLESISFEVAANPGQPSKPLSKVASGGELSRISLAIQVLLSNNQKIPTLIFDEVDTGIGGGVAETVGRQLRTLGASHQVMCVTHLPQVAAQGHQHLQVSKNIEGKTTRTQIELLSNAQRQEEIARMMGGMEITPQSRAHAKEMIERAEAPA
ncbi:MAG: DNA repair protein RecN [Pseudomonadota bacterium]|nr:DNA repair protein RecN [Pseudomonadota bacterium]